MCIFGSAPRASQPPRARQLARTCSPRAACGQRLKGKETPPPLNALAGSRHVITAAHGHSGPQQSASRRPRAGGVSSAHSAPRQPAGQKQLRANHREACAPQQPAGRKQQRANHREACATPSMRVSWVRWVTCGLGLIGNKLPAREQLRGDTVESGLDREGGRESEG